MEETNENATGGELREGRNEREEDERKCDKSYMHTRSHSHTNSLARAHELLRKLKRERKWKRQMNAKAEEDERKLPLLTKIPTAAFPHKKDITH